jgi:hypothetical protein
MEPPRLMRHNVMPKAPAPPVTDQQTADPVARVAVEADVRLVTHFQASGCQASGCGRHVKTLVTSDTAREVNCKACRRSRIFLHFAA